MSTEDLIALIRKPSTRRDDVVPHYLVHGRDVTDYPAINAAIMDRWSRSALIYIKKKAWADLARAAPKEPQ